jgi:ADP-ribose pyrophosphatase YjhB (NUDIX family)
MIYQNPGTVVVSVVSVNGGLLMVRRGLADGYGKLALPGGFQAVGETWQQAGAREVEEETGLVVDPAAYRAAEVVTVEDGRINLIFAYQLDRHTFSDFRSDHEVLEVVIVNEPVETAFETHTRHVKKFFSMADPAMPWVDGLMAAPA